MKSFDEIIAAAKNSKRRNLAVADATGASVIEALAEAENIGLIRPVLVGDAAKIEPLAKQFALGEYDIVQAVTPTEIATATVKLATEGKCDMIMKGKLPTPTLLKAVLDKENGLRGGGLLSHVAVMEVVGYPRLMLVTDGGMNIAPDVNQKAQILANAALVAKKLGIDKPKAAGLAAIETVGTDMPETIDYALLSKMSDRHQLGDVSFEGPLAVDVVLSKNAAKAKGIETEMSEATDIFLVPGIAAGNIFCKGLLYLAGAKVGGIIVGSKLPIVLLSRSDDAHTKLYSIALGCIAS